jgi:hypothetical protein
MHFRERAHVRDSCAAELSDAPLSLRARQHAPVLQTGSRAGGAARGEVPGTARMAGAAPWNLARESQSYSYSVQAARFVGRAHAVSNTAAHNATLSKVTPALGCRGKRAGCNPRHAFVRKRPAPAGTAGVCSARSCRSAVCCIQPERKTGARAVRAKPVAARQAICVPKNDATAAVDPEARLSVRHVARACISRGCPVAPRARQRELGEVRCCTGPSCALWQAHPSSV